MKVLLFFCIILFYSCGNQIKKIDRHLLYGTWRSDSVPKEIMYNDSLWSFSACDEGGECDTFSFRYKLKNNSLIYTFSTTWHEKTIIKKLTKDTLIFYNEHHTLFKYCKVKTTNK